MFLILHTVWFSHPFTPPGDTFGSTRRQRYGDIYKTQLLGAPTVMVYGEDAVRTVLAAEDKLVASDWPSVGDPHERSHLPHTT